MVYIYNVHLYFYIFRLTEYSCTLVFLFIFRCTAVGGRGRALGLVGLIQDVFDPGGGGSHGLDCCCCSRSCCCHRSSSRSAVAILGIVRRGTIFFVSLTGRELVSSIFYQLFQKTQLQAASRKSGRDPSLFLHSGGVRETFDDHDTNQAGQDDCYNNTNDSHTSVGSGLHHLHVTWHICRQYRCLRRRHIVVLLLFVVVVLRLSSLDIRATDNQISGHVVFFQKFLVIVVSFLGEFLLVVFG
mmetsp:Transcript_20030/g.21476  ORF Transcript_20030/g.21476 Transcript_20030/m.21476 type:complete len:242 (-) Transcript_20030:2597-3322(-)